MIQYLRVVAYALWIAPLSLMAGCCCCGSGTWTPTQPDSYADVQEATQGGDAVSTASVEGSALNRFFPPQEGDYDIVFKQEKTGFAQISLQKKADGTELATMSISDTINEPSAKDKFQGSTDYIQDQVPVARQGDQGTAVLVADRYQIAIRSIDPSFTEADRRAWFSKFDLAGLSQLK
jgi:hypothetical protein